MKYLIFLLLLSPAHVFFNEAVGQGYSTNNTIAYQAFLSNQFKFPRPQLLDTIDVGEYNWQTGLFTGLRSIEYESPGHGTTERRPPNVKSESPKHLLRFSVVNNPGGYSVDVNGVRYNSIPGNNLLYIPVQKVKAVNWKLQCGTRMYADKFDIIRLSFIAAGAFTIPLLPLALIYEPPKDQLGKNRATYTKSEYVNSSLSFEFSAGRETTTPQVSTFNVFKSLLGATASGLSSSPEPESKAAGTVLSILNAGLGNEVTATTVGTINENAITFNITEIFGNTLSTDENNGGPGIGDLFYCLRGCRFLWLIKDDLFIVSLLDYSGTHLKISSQGVKDSIRLNVNRELFAGLANYNPFTVHGPGAKFYGPRYTYLYTAEDAGAGSSENLFHSDARSLINRNTSVKYLTEVQEFTQGFLSYAGLSPYDETKSITVSTTNKYTSQVQNTTNSFADVQLYSDWGIQRIFDIYLDNVFGTYVVKEVLNLPTQATHTGTLRDSNGEPRPNSRMQIKLASKLYYTRTNEKGEYKFYSPGLKNYKQGKVVKKAKN